MITKYVNTTTNMALYLKKPVRLPMEWSSEEFQLVSYLKV